MAFTASSLPNILARLDGILTGNHTGKAEMNYPTPALEQLLKGQSADMSVLTNDAGQCVSVDAFFEEVGSHLIDTSANATDPVTQGCDLIDGNEAATRKINIEAGRIALSTFKVTAPKCANASTFEAESARLIRKAILDIRKQVQKKYYDLFTANSQADQWGQDTTFGTATTGNNRLAVAPASWDFELQRRMDLLAVNNFFPDNRLYINGTNLYLDKDLANYRALNDDKRDQNAIFGDSTITWDPKTLDQYLGRNSTFIVNPDNFLFFNSSFWTDAPVELDASKNHFVFAIDDYDPRYMWNDNGTMRPLRYHVETQKTCVGRDKLSNPIFETLYNLYLLGGIAKGPDGFNNPMDPAVAPTTALTGVIEIVNETPA